MRSPRFSQFAWGVLVCNLAVILWGAFVRATGSGAGCGSHWPLCDGQVIPRPKDVALLIEFAHRTSSGLALLLVLGLTVWAMRAFPSGHRVRRAALLSLFFVLTEALIGAALVLLEWVAQDRSLGRAIAMPAHLCNTYLLLASLTLTAWWGSGGEPLKFRGQGAVGWALVLALAASMLLGTSGAIAALGDTLFPVRHSMEALQQGLSPGAHFLVRLRILHPLIAISVGLYLLLVAGLMSHLRPSASVHRFAYWITMLFVGQITVGFVNVLLKAPVAIQILHLLLAALVWIVQVLLTAAAMAEGVAQVERSGAAQIDPLQGAPPGTVLKKASWRDYIALTKPRVISLLLFTTITAMFTAAGGWPGLGLLLAVSVGGYMAAGAANAINMVMERDLDARMSRTRKRPTVTQNVPAPNALLFGFGMALGSFVLLWGAANLLCAMLALAGLVCYVIIYTLLLKRRTWHNIVIGGAAGAFPPLVGWAAVTGDLSRLAWYLFAIIFVWTPVHFWALALLIKDDYVKAGVPMLPVVRGERATVVQIILYTLLTVFVSLLPLAHRDVGWVYLVPAMVLNALLIQRSIQLYRYPDRPRASSLFHYSMLYLALLFLMVAVDRARWM